MKKTLLLLIFSFFVFQCFSQITKPANTYLKISGGRVAFGTGDYFGYSIALDASKNIIKNSRWGLAKMLLGGEIIFENGSVTKYNYKDATTNIILWLKTSYYPFKKVVPGFNIQLGPTVGHTNNKTTVLTNPDGDPTFEPYLIKDNRVTVGYRISTGIEFDITRKFLLGFRLDWSNNTKGDINTLLALKAGLRF